MVPTTLLLIRYKGHCYLITRGTMSHSDNYKLKQGPVVNWRRLHRASLVVLEPPVLRGDSSRLYEVPEETDCKQEHE